MNPVVGPHSFGHLNLNFLLVEYKICFDLLMGFATFYPNTVKSLS